MTLFFYIGVALSLMGWTLASPLLADVPSEMRKYYIFTVVLLCLLACFVNFIWKKSGAKTKTGLTIALVFLNFGASIAYRMNLTTEQITQRLEADREIVLYSKNFFTDLVTMVVLFAIVYLIVRYTVLWRLKITNYLVIVGLPIVLLITRLTSPPINGSYISFFGVLIFGAILMGYPFVAAFFLSRKEERYLNGNIKGIPMNLVGMLLYTILLFCGSALCNEFGLLLVLALTATMLFYIKSRSSTTKLLYTVLCAGAGVFACTTVNHIHNRVRVWLNLVEIAKESELQQTATSVLYLFQNIHRTGWYGNGIGSLSKVIYPTLNTDHVIVMLIFEYSLILAILIIILGAILVKWMLQSNGTEGQYEYYLQLAMALVLGFTMVISVGSNLGSFITAGIPVPYVSDGISVNGMITLLIATRCALCERKVRT